MERALFFYTNRLATLKPYSHINPTFSVVRVNLAAIRVEYIEKEARTISFATKTSFVAAGGHYDKLQTFGLAHVIHCRQKIGQGKHLGPDRTHIELARANQRQ
jgi:hypothetical protein